MVLLACPAVKGGRGPKLYFAAYFDGSDVAPGALSSPRTCASPRLRGKLDQSLSARSSRSTSSGGRGLQRAIGPRSTFKLIMTLLKPRRLLNVSPNVSQLSLTISLSSITKTAAFAWIHNAGPMLPGSGPAEK